MKQLRNTHRTMALNYAAAEPEFNLFIIGDIEHYGLESSQVSAFTADSWDHGEFPYFILNYLGSYIVYSRDPDYDAGTVGRYLNRQGAKDISGKAEIVEKLIPWLPGMRARRTFLSRLGSMPKPPQNSESVCHLGMESAGEIYRLYMQIEELTGYHRKDRQEALEAIRQNLDISGRTYGLYVGERENRRLVSIASTSAENSLSAMVIGVGTLKEYRKNGYARAVISRLCYDCLQDGKKFLCLFYDNPEAGSIYESMGFQKIGYYMMIAKE